MLDEIVRIFWNIVWSTLQDSCIPLVLYINNSTLKTCFPNRMSTSALHVKRASDIFLTTLLSYRHHSELFPKRWWVTTVFNRFFDVEYASVSVRSNGRIVLGFYNQNRTTLRISRVGARRVTCHRKRIYRLGLAVLYAPLSRSYGRFSTYTFIRV